MTFERPLALLLLLAVPLLWWLHRRLRGPLEIVVASILPFAGATETSARAAQRRVIDPELACVLAAATCLVLSVAGPRPGARQQPELFVVVDDSPSMWLPRESGLSTQEEILRRIDETAGDDVRLRLVRERDGAAGDPARLDDPFGRADDEPLVAADLPASLARHADAARAAGLPGVVVATDQTLETGPDVAVVLPATRLAPFGWIEGVAVRDDELLVALAHTGDVHAVEVEVEAGGSRRVKRIEPVAAVATVRLAVPERGSFQVSARWFDAAGREVGAGSGAQARIAAERRPRVRRVRLDAGEGATAPRLTAALAALDVAVTADAAAVVDAEFVRAGGAIIGGGDAPTAYFSQGHGDAAVLQGSHVRGTSDFADVVPSAASRLVARGRLNELGGVLADELGVLARRHPLPIYFSTTLDPEHRDSTWHEDPSFVVFVAHVLEVLAGSGDEITLVRAVPPGEFVTPDPGTTDVTGPATADLLRLVGVTGPDDGWAWERGLALLAALLIAAAVLLSGRRLFASRRRPVAA